MVSFYHTARGNPDKTGIVSREHSYHGSTLLTQSVGKRPGDQVEGFRYIKEGIWHLSAPNMYRRPEGTTEAEFCDQLVEEFEDLIAKIGADKHRRLHRRADPGLGRHPDPAAKAT